MFGRFHGEDIFTTKESERLIRLPMFYGLERSSIDRIVALLGQALLGVGMWKNADVDQS
jgi:dTDP-4-amino-4,6-dideoxygalactose transaminase